MVQSNLRWYIGQGELRSLNMVQRVLRRYIGQCEPKKFKYGAKTSDGTLGNVKKNMVQRVLRWYIGQGELRSLNMVQRVLRWYIGQGELRSLKYGAKSPQMVHWAM